MSVSGGYCAVVGSGGGSRGAKPRVGGCALCWVGLGSVVVGLGSLVWWASVSVSGGCCVMLCGGGGGRGAKPRVGGCALGVGRCVFRGLGQDFAKMVHFRPSENLENNFRQHVVLLEYLPTRSIVSRNILSQNIPRKKNQNAPPSEIAYATLWDSGVDYLPPARWPVGSPRPERLPMPRGRYSIRSVSNDGAR